MQKAGAAFAKAEERHVEIAAKTNARAAELGFPTKKPGFTPTPRNP
jgi:hypothetical protein